jgi:hypothetical protein
MTDIYGRSNDVFANGIYTNDVISLDNTADINLGGGEINLNAPNVFVNGAPISGGGGVTNPMSAELNANDFNIINAGTILATSFVKNGGTSQQYLMGDGSALQYSANSGNSNFYLYNSVTNQSPTPANGDISYNTVEQKQATEIYISHRTRDNIDIEVFFKALSTLNDVYIQDQENSDNNITYNITGPPVIVNQAQVTIPVNATSSNGTGSTSFGNGHNILLSFFTNSIETDARLTTLENKTQLITASSNRTILAKSSQCKLTSLDNFSVTLDVGLDTFPKFVISGTQVNSLIPMNMSNQILGGLPTPTTDDAAANKLYVDNATAAKLDVAGGTMFGSLSMSNSKITSLGTPTLATDAANKSYVDTAVGGGAGLSPYFRQVNQLAFITTAGLLETTMTTTPVFGSFGWTDTAVGQSRKWSIQGLQNRGTFSATYTIRFKSGAGGTTLNAEWILPAQGPSAAANQPFTLDITTVRGAANSLSYFAKFESVGASTVGFFLFTSQNQTGGVVALNSPAIYNITVQSSIASASLTFTYVEVMALIK